MKYPILKSALILTVSILTGCGTGNVRHAVPDMYDKGVPLVDRSVWSPRVGSVVDEIETRRLFYRPYKMDLERSLASNVMKASFIDVSDGKPLPGNLLKDPYALIYQEAVAPVNRYTASAGQGGDDNLLIMYRPRGWSATQGLNFEYAADMLQGVDSLKNVPFETRPVSYKRGSLEHTFKGVEIFDDNCRNAHSDNESELPDCGLLLVRPNSTSHYRYTNATLHRFRGQIPVMAPEFVSPFYEPTDYLAYSIATLLPPNHLNVLGAMVELSRVLGETSYIYLAPHAYTLAGGVTGTTPVLISNGKILLFVESSPL